LPGKRAGHTIFGTLLLKLQIKEVLGMDSQDQEKPEPSAAPTGELSERDLDQVSGGIGTSPGQESLASGAAAAAIAMYEESKKAFQQASTIVREGAERESSVINRL
jgi:hypothetical protein